LILPSILVTLLPVSPIYQFKGHRNPTAVKEKQIYNPEALRKIFELMFHPLKVLFFIRKALALCGWLDGARLSFHLSLDY